MRLIDADALIVATLNFCNGYKVNWTDRKVISWINHAPTIDAVVLPCKIGDTAFVIRNYKGTPLPQQGFVSEMTFTNDMRLMIVVKHCARGIWGETVFPTYEAAMAAIAERRNHA